MIYYSNKLAKDYIKNRGECISTDSDFLRILREKISSGDVVLDFGCGDGRYTLELSSRVYEIIGIDSSQVMIDTANKELNEQQITNARFLVTDGRETTFEDDSFDVIFANFVLVHFDDLRVVLSEIKRILKKDGFFIATLNCADINDSSWVTIYLGREQIEVQSFLRTDTELKEQISESGFKLFDYEKIENLDAKVNLDQVEKLHIQNFHTVLFSCKK